MNKKGQFESVLLVVISLFIVAILIFFLTHVTNDIYDSLDNYFEETEWNGTQADVALTKITTLNQSIWDWAFLAIFIGFMIQMLLLSFASRANVAFFWIFVLLGMLILIVGVTLSNIWQDTVANDVFTTTLTQFPITNALLGSFFPMVIVAILFLGMIILFGKPPGQQT